MNEHDLMLIEKIIEQVANAFSASDPKPPNLEVMIRLNLPESVQLKLLPMKIRRLNSGK